MSIEIVDEPGPHSVDLRVKPLGILIDSSTASYSYRPILPNEKQGIYLGNAYFLQ
jgi:hypothetical protein